jgi:hypothetical protein
MDWQLQVQTEGWYVMRRHMGFTICRQTCASHCGPPSKLVASFIRSLRTCLRMTAGFKNLQMKVAMLDAGGAL